MTACCLDSLGKGSLWFHTYPGTTYLKFVMQEQKATKVTLYLPPDLHRQLKIRSAVEGEAMSAIAERAIGFYLSNPDVVDDAEMVHGQTHRIYSCPECSAASVMRDGELVPLSQAVAVDETEDLSVRTQGRASDSRQPGEDQLVVC